MCREFGVGADGRLDGHDDIAREVGDSCDCRVKKVLLANLHLFFFFVFFFEFVILGPRLQVLISKLGVVMSPFPPLSKSKTF